RAAAHEPRVRALIANSPILDLFAYMRAFLGYDPSEAPASEDVRLADIDHIPEDELPAAQRAASLSLMRRFGRPSLSEVFRYLREFRITDPSLIACPSLALAGQDEGVEPLRQLEEICATVDGPVRSRVDRKGTRLN